MKLTRARFLTLLGSGLAVAISGCTARTAATPTPEYLVRKPDGETTPGPEPTRATSASPTSKATSAATAKPTAPAKQAGVKLRHGMQVDPSNDYQRALRLLKQAGFDWAKVQLRWEELEIERDNIHWHVIDPIVNGAKDEGIHLLLSIVTAPRWARPADANFSVPGPPANPADYARFVTTILKRHPGKVEAVEVWNEQNLQYEWGGMGRRLNAGQYVALLKAAYAAIKATDSKVLVVSGAPTPTGVDDGDTAFDDLHFLEMMYAEGLKAYCDVVGAHPSGFNNPPNDTPTKATVTSIGFKGHWSFYFRRFEQYREVMARNGDEQKELWFTEFGWASSQKPAALYAYAKDVSEEDQARYLVSAFEKARENGQVGAMFLWNLNFGPGADPDDKDAKLAFSVLRRDWSPRPAYTALKAMPK